MKSIKLTGLWLHKKSDGTSYMMGTIGQATVFVSANDYKKTDKEPDYYLSIAEKKKNDEKKDFSQTKPKPDFY